MRNFLIALQFLTILPIETSSEIKPEDLGGALMYFPIIGALIGLVLAFISLGLSFLPPLVTGALILLALVVITGAIHLEGFADTCDGFYAGRSQERILEIMRDSHLGTMGAIGLICLILLKFVLIVSIPQNILWKGLIMMVVFARWSQGLACCISKYVRQEGKARYFIEYAGRRTPFVGGLFALAVFLLLAKFNGLVLFILSALLALLFINYVKRKIGGMTGDTIGAISELTEVFVLFGSLILSRSNLSAP